MSPRGTTYITVRHGGFSYRKTFSSETKQAKPSHVPPIQVQSTIDEIKTADVEELLESSKSDLVDSLNKRARMFNPASLLFVLSAIFILIGLVELGNSATPPLPPLPDVSSLSDAARLTNRTDEYALMLARYGQPSQVTLTNAATVPVRLAVWNASHLGVTFVPTGCVDSYAYFQVHKNDPLPVHQKRRIRRQISPEPVSPPCIPSTGYSSTIVAYRDMTSGSSIDYSAAYRSLESLDTKSQVPPAVNSLEESQGKKGAKAGSPVSTVSYEEGTSRSEQRRISEQRDVEKQALKYSGLFSAAALLTLVSAFVVHRRNREKRTTRLAYELTGIARTQQHILDQALSQLGNSRAVWRIDSQSAVYDWKRNAGASSNVNRQQISVQRATPPRVESNVQPMCIDIGKLRMFFLPDQILYWHHGTFASIDYDDLRFEAGTIHFIEEQIQTSDSRQIGSTWRYVRKDGGPDLRFNNNRQLPIMLYGVANLTSSGGLNMLFHTSNLDAAGSFTTSFRSYQNTRAQGFDQLPETGEAKEAHRAIPSISPTVEAAMDALGVKPGATIDQVATAYRHMAQMYHPDKTAGLGPELQKLADERMKQINAAHQTVKRYLEAA